MTSRAGQGGSPFNTWGELRDHAIRLFGETPHPATEQEIIDAYEQHPDQVARAIEAVAADVAAGTARSGWGVLRTRASSIRHPVANPTRSTSLEREKAIARAEQWIHAAGIHFDSPSELLDELFGDTGPLRPYAQVDLVETGRNDRGPVWALTPPRGDTHLAHRLIDLWKTERPKGEKIEADAQVRAETWKQQRKETACTTTARATGPLEDSSETSSGEQRPASTATNSAPENAGSTSAPTASSSAPSPAPTSDSTTRSAPKPAHPEDDLPI